ncbi:GntP family permease [Dermabacteraceae bacterium P13147]
MLNSQLTPLLLPAAPLPMAPQEWQQTMSAGPLLGIAAAAIAVILVAVIVFRTHAFITLIVVSLLTAFATGIPVSNILPTMMSGFSGTLGSVALLVGLGAMLGKLVEASGGAKVLADAMISAFGEKRAPLALGVASLLMGFPIFFDAGLIVMLPVIFAVAHRLRGSIVLYSIPAAAAFSVMHVLTPPHPGPVGAGVLLGANIGTVMIVGLLIAIPTFYVSGYLWGKFISQRVNVQMPKLFGSLSDSELPSKLPSVGLVIAMLVLPALLVFFNTGLSTLMKTGHIATVGEGKDAVAASELVQVLLLIGQTPVALLISTIVAMLLLGRYITRDKTALEATINSSLGPVCAVILITGAGGMFGGVLRTSGIGDALSSTMADMGIPLLLATYLIAVALRLAQGSATVALLTTAALVAPAVEAAGMSSLGLACIVLAASAGSVFASHVNDSGFWLVGRLMGMDVKTTLQVWTAQQTIESVTAFTLVSLVYLFA